MILDKTQPTGIELAVCEDIAARQRHGINKYGTTVADNPLSLKQWLQHAYEETLDKAVYLKRAIAEVDKTTNAVGATCPLDDDGDGNCPRCVRMNEGVCVLKSHGARVQS